MNHQMKNQKDKEHQKKEKIQKKRNKNIIKNIK